MMALCVNPVEGPNKIGSVGMPLPDVHVRIFDADEGTTRDAGRRSRRNLFFSGAADDGLLESPDETAGVLREHIEADGTRRWLHTGDLGYLDEDGYVFIVDRKKDLIKTSGYQVWPREIEETLSSHPAVAEVGVAGVPDELKGEAVHAWVVLRKAKPRTRRSCAPSAARNWRRTRSPLGSSSGRSCRKQWSARSCAARSGRNRRLAWRPVMQASGLPDGGPEVRLHSS